ncbi:major facilitator superfamily domain-containing protein [Aspergillus crustosus]
MADVKEVKESDVGPTREKNDTSPAESNVDLFADINEKALVRRLDYKLLPPLTILYLLSFLDRSNVGNARLEGLTDDVGMSGNQYLTENHSPNLATLTLVWGIITTLLGVVENYAGYLTSRTALGIAGSGLFPGVVFYLSMWYKRNEQHYRVALFFSAASLAGAFGGILAWGIAHMDGEGLLTVVVALLAYFWVNNYPATAEFLSDKERSFIQYRLKNDSDATREEDFSWGAVADAVKDPKVWLYGLGFHTMSLPLYTLSLFLPSIIRALGYSAAKAQLLTVPPYALGFVTTITVAILSERTRRRAPYIMGSSAFACIGYIILITGRQPGVQYTGAFFCCAGIYPAVAIVLSWPANNVSGQTKRAIANAMQISIGNLGAVLGTQLYRTETEPRYYLGHGSALGYLVANIVVVFILWQVLNRENVKKAEAREREGPQALMGDVGDDFQGDKDPRWVFQT